MDFLDLGDWSDAQPSWFLVEVSVANELGDTNIALRRRVIVFALLFLQELSAA